MSPYSAVDMNRMAAAFHMSVEKTESELKQLIMQKEIQARIDSEKKILHKRVVDQRAVTYSNAIQTGDVFCLEIDAAILRINLLQDGVVYTANSGSPYASSWKRVKSHLTMAANDTEALQSLSSIIGQLQ